MANAHVNKVVYGGTTLIDLTGDNVTAASVLSGKIFHLPSGARAVGTYSGGGSGVSKSGSMISLNSNLVVNIQPQQSGSGNPSASNIRPLSGWTACQIYSGGDNYTHLTPGSVSTSTGEVGAAANSDYYYSDMIPLIDGEGIYIKFMQRASGTRNFNRAFYDGDKQFISGSTTTVGKSLTLERFYTRMSAGGNTIIPDAAKYMRFSFGKGANGILYFAIPCKLFSIAFPSEAGTVYAGSLDAANAVLKARPYYASYNGQTLVGPWISDRDVYAAGRTPTTGAQVVDLGGVETVYQLAPPQIMALIGAGNIWSDCGDLSFTCN